MVAPTQATLLLMTCPLTMDCVQVNLNAICSQKQNVMNELKRVRRVRRKTVKLSTATTLFSVFPRQCGNG